MKRKGGNKKGFINLINVFIYFKAVIVQVYHWIVGFDYYGAEENIEQARILNEDLVYLKDEKMVVLIKDKRKVFVAIFITNFI